MAITDDLLWVTVAVTIQILGLISVVLARLAEGCGAQRVCQLGVFLLLLLVGAVAVLAVSSGHLFGIWCGGSFSLMVLGATLDMRGARPTTTF